MVQHIYGNNNFEIFLIFLVYEQICDCFISLPNPKIIGIWEKEI